MQGFIVDCQAFTFADDIGDPGGGIKLGFALRPDDPPIYWMPLVAPTAKDPDSWDWLIVETAVRKQASMCGDTTSARDKRQSAGISHSTQLAITAAEFLLSVKGLECDVTYFTEPQDSDAPKEKHPFQAIERALLAHFRKLGKVPVVPKAEPGDPPSRRAKRAAAIVKLSMPMLVTLQEDEDSPPTLATLEKNPRTGTYHMEIMESTDGIDKTLADSVYFKGNQNGLPDRFVSNDVAKRLISSSMQVKRVIHRPMLSPRRQRILQAGMDLDSKYFKTTAPRLAIPSNPDADDIAEAKETLFDVFKDFKFVRFPGGGSSLAGALAAIFEQAVFPLIQGPRPGYLCEANAIGQGTGKTLLAQVMATIIDGTQAVPAQKLPSEECEIEKRVLSILMQRKQVALFDNLKSGGKIQSATLDVLLTATNFQGRILGKSQMVRYPNLATWIFTANGATLDRDLSRRMVTVQINRSEPPYQIPDLMLYVTRNLDELVQASMTLACAWVAAGSPEASIDNPSYESWGAVIGGILDFLGVKGLQDCINMSRDKDQSTQEIFSMLETWEQAFGRSLVAPEDVYSRCVEGRGILLDLVESVARNRSVAVTVGTFLSRHSGIPLPGNYRVLRKRTAAGHRYVLCRGE